VAIELASKDLGDEANDERLLRRRHDPQPARQLRQQLDDRRAAPALEVRRNLPGRCHELRGDRAGQLAVDLVHPYRLIFEPADAGCRRDHQRQG